MSGEPSITFYFCDVPGNKLQKTPSKNIQRCENDNEVSMTMSGETCLGDPVYDFFKMTCTHAIKDCERTIGYFEVGFFASCY